MFWLVCLPQVRTLGGSVLGALLDLIVVPVLVYVLCVAASGFEVPPELVLGDIGCLPLVVAVDVCLVAVDGSSCIVFVSVVGLLCSVMQSIIVC